MEDQVTLLQSRQLEAKRSLDEPLKDDQSKDPVKKMRMEVNMDPFACFPYHITQIMMNHFNAMDFLKMTKVSKDWMMIVESDEKAAMKLKEILTFDVRDDKEEVCLKLFNDVEYKYLTVHSSLLGKTCLERFSSTIESLSIYPSDSNEVLREPLNLSFLQLKLLRVGYQKHHHNSKIYEWFANCKFPVLNELIFTSREEEFSDDPYIPEIFEENDPVAMKKTLVAMPNLTHLDINYDKFPYDFFEERFSKLESIGVFSVHRHINEALSSSALLQTLNVEVLDEGGVDLVFSQMKNLKSFRASFYNDDARPLSELSINTSITSLYLFEDEPLTIISKLLKALPSLEKFRHDGRLRLSVLDVIGKCFC